MQAGDRRKAGEGPTIEQLLEAAARGRSKYDPIAGDIDRLRAGGVTLRAIAAWIETQGIKAEVGELGQWLKRRKARQARLKEHQALLSQGDGQAGKEGAKTPATASAREAATLKASQSAAPIPAGSIDPSDRRGTSEVERDLDARIHKAKQEVRSKRSPFALKGANK